jgi:hypothetical protein
MQVGIPWKAALVDKSFRRFVFDANLVQLPCRLMRFPKMSAETALSVLYVQHRTSESKRSNSTASFGPLRFLPQRESAWTLVNSAPKSKICAE